MIDGTLQDGFRQGGCSGEMCTRSLLQKKIIAKLRFRSSIEESLFLVSINSSEEVDRSQLKFRDLINLFKDLKLKSFSGNAIVQVESEPSRMFSFNLGSLAWVSGGIDPLNRWQRNLELANLHLSLPPKSVSAPGKILIKSYLLAQKLATIEVLFDLIQICQCTNNHLSYQLIEIDPAELKLNPDLPRFDLQPLLVTAIESWREWDNAGLAEYFPSRFPTIDRSQELPMFTNIDNLAAILQSMDGNKSLRNLAIDYRQSLVKFTKDILPILGSGAIDLSLFPQSQLNLSQLSEVERQISKKNTSQPIDRSKLSIACIHDSLSICKSIELFLTRQGYQSYGIQDPLKILTTLIKNKPNLIFLDLSMPMANGYEICQQIRRTPSLKDIPIVILTEKDGLFDRMRAKAIGANAFLSKPIAHTDILRVLGKYLEGGE
jgi:two-component system, chemotaxis family, response regulator PixG